MQQNQMIDQHYTSNIGQAGPTGKRILSEEEINAKALELSEQVQHDWACGKDRSHKAEFEMRAAFDNDQFLSALADCIYVVEHSQNSYCHKVALEKLVLSHRKEMSKSIAIDLEKDNG